MEPLQKIKYLNIGDRKENIRKLKEENKTKIDEKYQNFHKKFKKVENINDEVFNSTGLKNFNKSQLSNNEEYLKTTSNFYTTTNSLFKKLNNTDNHNKMLATHSTGKGFYKPSQTSYTNTSISRPVPTLEEEDMLVGLYFMNEENGAKKSHLNKDEKHFVLKKFNIDKTLKHDDEEFVEDVLKIKYKDEDVYNKTMNEFNKTKFKSHPYFFDDPKKSLKKLKMNIQIYEHLTNTRVEKQISTYMTSYNEVNDRNIKILQMPKIRQIKLKKKGKLTLEDYQESSNNDKISIKQFTRDQLLGNTELPVSYEEDHRHKPPTRSHFSALVDGNSVIIFGGVNSDRLCDIWFCDLKGKLNKLLN